MKTTLEQITAAGHDADEAPKITALCEYLECAPDELELARYDHYGLAQYSYAGRDYAIGTDAECDEAAQKNIADSAWAFNASFLASFCDLPEEVFTALSEKCESGNDPIVRLIEKSGGMEKFAQEAISADGRGHFLSSYDGEENEQGEFFIYRVN